MRTGVNGLLFALSWLVVTGSSVASNSSDLIDVVFDEVEKTVIERYYKEHTEDEEDYRDGGGKQKDKGKSKELAPGLAKKEELPPGLEKQLERNGTLPPGLAKRELPKDLQSRLPETKPGYERVIIGTDVVLIEKGTEIIKDILRDVIRH